MRELSIKSMIIGASLASLFFVLFGFVLLLEFEYPKPDGWPDDFKLKMNPITQNLRVYDVETKTTVFWTPGNPLILPSTVKRVSSNKWIAEFEKPIPKKTNLASK